MSTFLELCDGVAAYYGSGSDQWTRIVTSLPTSGFTPENIAIMEQVPGVTLTRSASGAILGYDYRNPFAALESAASAADSNLIKGAYGPGSFEALVPATQTTQGQVTTLTSGPKLTNGGATLSAIADRVSLAYAGVALGSKLGLAIDTALYSANPQWWDEHFPSINPQTWDDIATTSAGKWFIRTLYGLEDDEATMYLDERVLAYAYMMMLDGGGYDQPSTYIEEYDPISADWIPQYPELFQYPLYLGGSKVTYINEYYPTPIIYEATGTGTIYSVCFQFQNGNTVDPFFVSDAPFTMNNNWRVLSVTIDGHTYYYAGSGNSTSAEVVIVGGRRNALTGNFVFGTDVVKITFGNPRTVTPALPGVEPNPEAGIQIDPENVIDPTTGEPVTPASDPADALTALRTAYPGLFGDTVYEDIPQGDGTVTRITYIPVPYPTTDQDGQPVTDVTTGVDPQQHPEFSPQTRPSSEIGQFIDDTTWPPEYPDTGSGTMPGAILPPGSAHALYSIYNPTDAELSSFGAWLWSSNFVDQLLKLFSDPMQAIIGLHKVFVTPPTSGRGYIKVGYLDSGVQCNLVSGQYVTVDCGSVALDEFFGNAMDYEPYTQVYLYLPFVGIERLDCGDVMRAELSIAYQVDVLTGACLAEVTVTRDGAGGVLYSYAGNAAVQYPVSAGSYMGIFSSLLSVAGGVAGTIATGGALAPLAMGAAGGILSARTRVQHSGGFSGNAGAMGNKIPYLIVTRPQAALARDFPAYVGYPANHRTVLGACSGFVRCLACHLEGVPATAAELDEIETALMDTGVLI